MSTTRNRLVAPRNVVNTKMLYSFYILKELSKGEVMFGNKVLETFRDVFQTSNLPFPVSSSTIYETFYDLEEKGYVISKWTGDEFLNKRSKKIYLPRSDTSERVYRSCRKPCCRETLSGSHKKFGKSYKSSSVRRRVFFLFPAIEHIKLVLDL